MNAENLRKLSWWAFKATFICALVGILTVIAVPNPSYRDTADLTVRIIAISGFSLIGVAVIANFVSLVSGVIAWIKGPEHCRWIIINGILLLIPIVGFLLSWLNV
jgi:hypothetical protein